MGYIPIELQEQANTLMLPILALIGLAFAVRIDPYIKKPAKRVMLMIDTLVLTVILANCVSNALEAAWNPAYRLLLTGLAVYCYSVRPMVIYAIAAYPVIYPPPWIHRTPGSLSTAFAGRAMRSVMVPPGDGMDRFSDRILPAIAILLTFCYLTIKILCIYYTTKAPDLTSIRRLKWHKKS